MRKSEMLMKCKGFLWDGVSERNGKVDYICFALQYAIGSDNADPLCKIISGRLEGWPSVVTWLRHECKIPKEQLTYAAIQKHRHQWVDLMIKEFEAKGD